MSKSGIFAAGVVLLLGTSLYAAEPKVLLDCNNGAMKVEEVQDDPRGMTFYIRVYDAGVANYLRDQGLRGIRESADGSMEFAGWLIRSPGSVRVRTYFMGYSVTRKGLGAELSLGESPTHGPERSASWYFESCQGEL